MEDQDSPRFREYLPPNPEQIRTYSDSQLEPDPGFAIPLPSNEITSTVILGAVLAMLGNKFLGPLFTLILDNFKSDQKATSEVVELLKNRISALEADKEKQAVDHERYLEALNIANQQASSITKILEMQANGLEKLSEGLFQLRQEMLQSHANIQSQLDNVTLAPKPRTRTPGGQKNV